MATDVNRTDSSLACAYLVQWTNF